MNFNFHQYGLFNVARELKSGSVGCGQSTVDDAATLALITQQLWRHNIRDFRAAYNRI